MDTGSVEAFDCVAGNVRPMEQSLSLHLGDCDQQKIPLLHHVMRCVVEISMKT